MAVIFGALLIFVLLNISSAFPNNNSNLNNYGAELVVQTTAGRVRGELGGTTVGQKKPIYRFRSIPFAEPPVGNLRFEPPVAKKSWSGILDVSKPGPICIQGNDPVQGSEDCLFLKVYTTKLPNKNNKLPVMVWVYGGAFFTGAPDFSEHAPDFLLDQDVIVVSFHYRVGIFGFFSTGDITAPGNAGLKDQILALQWVKQNIENFGGDSNKITLFGQSAGSASISYLLNTDKTAGLFDRVILQSGHALDQWALRRDPKDFAEVVAKDLSVSTSSSQTILDGLRKVDANTLQASTVGKYNTYLIANQNPLHGLPIAPVIEPDHAGAVVTGCTYDKLQNGQFHHVPILIGHTSNEALLNSLSGILKVYLYLYDLLTSRLIPIGMNPNTLVRPIIGSNIKSHYFGSRSIASSEKEFMKFMHDDQFERGIEEAARLYAQRVPVYYYKFAHEGSLYGVTDRAFPGVGHSEDLGYIFDFGYTGSAADYTTRNQVVLLWTNFAKTGNPTPQADVNLNRVIWPVFSADGNVRQLNIDHGLSVVTNPTSNNQYWRNLFDRYGRRPFLTY